MNRIPALTSPIVLAKIAGLLYFTVVPLGIFGVLYVPSSLIVPGDAATTAANILASESIYRLGLVSHLLAPLFMLATALVLYRLLQPVGETLSALMVITVILGVSTDLSSLSNQFAALRFLGGADYLNVFTAEQLQALALFYLRYPGGIAAIFWGLWLLPLGCLVFKSGFLPKILGILLMVSCFMYLIDSFSSFLGYSVNIGMFGAIGEVLFILWLLIKGVNVGRWEKRAHESA
jgi:hypothetical protein